MRACTTLLIAMALTIAVHGQRLVPSALNIPTTALGLFALEEHDGRLIVGGQFYAVNGVALRSIAAWNGSQVQAMPGAFDGTAQDHVRAMLRFQGDLIAGGQAPGVGHIARWNGSGWSVLGAGLPARVNALCLHNGGLIAGCQNGAVLRWDGSAWQSLGSQMNGPVLAVEEHQGQLYAGGAFTMASGQPMRRLARWTGEAWEEAGGGFNGQVSCLRSDALGLLIGGAFTHNADSSMMFPACARLIPAGLSTIPGVTTGWQITGFFRHPDGRLLVAGAETDGFSFSLGMVRAMRPYNGQLFVAGQGSVMGAWRETGSLVRLVPGTQEAVIDVNDIVGNALPHPTSFHRYATGRSGFEALKGQQTHSIYATSPWIRAYSNGQLHQAMPWYFISDTADEHRHAGPLAAQQDDSFYERYHRVWKLDRAMIQDHIMNWNAPGHVIPEVIANWPGNGDPANGEPARIAPFQDLDGDGTYEPQLGEYPLIKGTQAVYSILHLVNQSDFAPAGAPAPPFDLHVMQYAHESVDPAIAQSVFVNYRFVNRSAFAFDSIRFAQFCDFDLGCANDDFAGCDSTRSLAFAYNWDEFDETCLGAVGYGAQPPAQGLRFMNHPMRSHRDFHRETLQPITPEDLLYGLSQGQPFMNLGYPTHFQYPGGAWADTDMVSVDRKTVSATGPFTLAPGDTLCIDLAFIYARAASGGAYASVEALKVRSDSVQAFYDAQGLACRQFPVMTSVSERTAGVGLRIHPNPAAGQVAIVGLQPMEEVLVMDMQGRAVHRQRATESRIWLDVSGWAPGAYVLRSGDSAVRMLKE